MRSTLALPDVPTIAVVGMSCRFPGATNPEEFWNNLRDGVESVTHFTDDELRAAGVPEELLQDPNYIKSGCVLENMEMFDPAFFGLSPRDAAIMDPQHRQFLECSWEALESAGHVPERFPGAIGVFGGCGMNSYMIHNLAPNTELIRAVGMFLVRHTGNDKDFLTTRVSYHLNLRGPSVSIQTACSTSLVAIHAACQSLLSGECDLALAGGVTIEVPHRHGYGYEDGGILSKDGHCRPFDADSSGTIFGSGAGVVVLRRLEDAIADGDYIYAIVRGSAINNDGAMKVGYLAPSVEGQSEAIAEAITIAGISADTISYVEAHGTGTAIGDPIEVTALTQAFHSSTSRTGFCGLGSLKSNIGHLDTAAGVASFIKVALALKNRYLPPTLHFKAANPHIDFAATPFVANTAGRLWVSEEGPLRAGVSSLGVGGTNAHLILEQPPDVVSLAPGKPLELLVLSARSEAALDEAVTRFVNSAEQMNDRWSDVVYTYQIGRRAFPHRVAIVARDCSDAMTALSAGDSARVLRRRTIDAAPPKVTFVFPGGGSQYPGMARDLYTHQPVFRRHLDECLKIGSRHAREDLRSWLFPSAEGSGSVDLSSERPSLALPVLFAVEYALSQLWMQWGVRPESMIGHSLGEYTAACLAGVMSLEDAIAIVCVRGKLFEQLPSGGMLSVPLTPAELAPLLGPKLSLAAVNGPSLCVASGENAALIELEKALADRGVDCKRVHIAVAAHSRMLDPILADFRAVLSTIKLRRAEIPVMSNLTGVLVTDELQDPEYWVRHLRNTVRFAEGVRVLLEDPDRLLLEVGPGQGLTSLIALQLQGEDRSRAMASMPRASEAMTDFATFLTAVGKLWTAGVEIDWKEMHAPNRRTRIPLPTYPFEHQKYWIDPPAAAQKANSAPADPLQRIPNVSNWFSVPTWRRLDQVRGESRLQGKGTWLVFGDTLGVSSRLIEHLDANRVTCVHVQFGGSFARLNPNSFTVRMDNRADHDALLEHVGSSAHTITRVVYTSAILDACQQANTTDMEGACFWSPLAVLKALAADELTSPVRLVIVSNHLSAVHDGETILGPHRALLLGPISVGPKEIEGLSGTHLDVDWSPEECVANIAVLAAEVAREPEERVVALRGGIRWTPDFQSRCIPAGVNGTVLRQKGVYVITGGAGGIGSAIAKRLATEAQARIVLFGRSALPPRETWADLAHVRLVRALGELEAGGVDYEYIQVDVTDADALSRHLETVQTRLGFVNGVFHAAGDIRDGLLVLKEESEARKVLAPKVKGTVALVQAITAVRPVGLDFLCLFSSTSTVLGPEGQVDYVAANGFLDAFSRSDHGLSCPVVTVNWGAWRDAGMLTQNTSPVLHPLLGSRKTGGNSDVVFTRKLTGEEWVLQEHKILKRTPVLPGTAYVEMARAAYAATTGRLPEIRTLVFIAPLEFTTGPRVVQVSLKPQDEGYTLSIASRPVNAGDSFLDEHVRGHLVDITRLTVSESPAQLRQKCPETTFVASDCDYVSKQQDHLTFGPRWSSVKQVRTGGNNCLAELELATEYHSDLNDYHVHPALLDLATMVSLPLLADYAATQRLYVPLSYGTIRVYGRMGPRVTVFSRCRDRNDSELAIFDLTVYDPNGTALVDVEELVLRPLDPAVLVRRGEDAGLQGSPAATQPTLLALALERGIGVAEGPDALLRALSMRGVNRVFISSMNLHPLLERIAADTQSRRSKRGQDAHPRTRSTTTADYVAPRNVVEEKIAAVWQEALGVDRVGATDNFFELGGHSLLLTQTLTRLRKLFSVELPPGRFFAKPTVAELAQEIGEQTSRPSLPTLGRISRSGFRVKSSSLPDISNF